MITAVAMLVTGWVSSRIGAKRTLIAGPGADRHLRGARRRVGLIGEIVGFRAGWGLGNALFIATSLAVIVSSASGGFAGAIILYETALGRRHRRSARWSAASSARSAGAGRSSGSPC